jgi:hypothetical protein
MREMMALENSALPILTYINQTKALVSSESHINDNRVTTRQERKTGEQMDGEAKVLEGYLEGVDLRGFFPLPQYR